MDWTKDCVAVIPALNEGGRVGSVVRTVRDHLATVIVVDDGSDDSTGDEATAAGAKVIRNSVAMGKGESLVLGWTAARAAGFKWALCLDGDGQHDPNDCTGFFEAAEKAGAPLVVGNRMSKPQDMPWLRRRVNRWMSERISRAVGRELPDTQCGFRLMRLDVWANLPRRVSHFEIESEIIHAFATAGHDIHFVPIRVIYSEERSKIRPVRDTFRWLKWWREVNRL